LTAAAGGRPESIGAGRGRGNGMGSAAATVGTAIMSRARMSLTYRCAC
jgi:hypothetical protein